MICAQFIKNRNSQLIGLSIQGHAMYNEYGEDIVCASVTSAVQLTINGITEILNRSAKVLVEENKIYFELTEKSIEKMAVSFLKSLEFHLKILQETYPQTIEISYLEV